MRTEADYLFSLLEDDAMEVLDAMEQTSSEPYHGTLLSDMVPLDGNAQDILVHPLTVGDAVTVEKILRAGNLGYAYLYPKSTGAPEVSVFSMPPEHIAYFLGSHQFDCAKMVLTDLFDSLILDTMYGFIDHCPDRKLLAQILTYLVPIQMDGQEPEEFPIVSYDTFDAYNLLCDLLQAGSTLEQLRSEKGEV